MINTAVMKNYVLYVMCCHRKWTLTLGLFYSLWSTVYYSLSQSSCLLLCKINHYYHNVYTIDFNWPISLLAKG